MYIYLASCRIQWTDAMVKLLLTEINNHVEFVTSPLNKQIWRDIAASINIHGYNLSAEHCNIKWNGMKKKYKTLKDAKNKTGAARQRWEYYDIINDMLVKKPDIVPLSLASSSRGFQLNQTALSTSESTNIETNFNDCTKENEENLHSIQSTNFAQNRIVRKRKSKTPVWIEQLIEQRQQHHERNYAQRERFISLLEKYLNK